MMRRSGLAPMLLCLLVLSGCARSRPPSPVDMARLESGKGEPAVANMPAASANTEARAPSAGAKITVLMVPKLKGIPYFNACERGARQAQQELGNVDVVFDGPTEDKVDAQIQLIDGYIAQDVDVIAVSPNDPDSIAPVLKKARDKGLHVITWDADANAQKSQREFFVNQASTEAVGKALVDEMAAQVGPSARVAIITSSLTAANQNAWIAAMKKHMAERYPKMRLVCEPKPSQEDQQLAIQAAQDLLKTYPDLQGIFGISSVAFPGAAEGVQKAKRAGKVAVVGLATPQDMKPWVDAGVVKTVILWNPVDLGYLTIHVARALCDGKLTRGTTKLSAGRLGDIAVSGDQVLLGEPLRFTKENIAQYDF